MTEPTKADLARDAESDLAVCEAATPGPYPVKRTIHSIPYIPNVAQFTNFDPHERVYLPAEENCAFLVLAREALPAWIRRAEASKEKNEQLLNALSAAYNYLLSHPYPHSQWWNNPELKKLVREVICPALGVRP